MDNLTADIYVYDLTTQTKTFITQVGNSDPLAAISGNHVIWQKSNGTTLDVFVYDMSTGLPAINISDDNVNTDQGAMIDGDYIVWQKTLATDGSRHTYLYEISTETTTYIGTNAPTDISGDYMLYGGVYQISTGTTDPLPSGNFEHIDGDYVVGTSSGDVKLYQVSTGVTTTISNDAHKF